MSRTVRSSSACTAASADGAIALAAQLVTQPGAVARTGGDAAEGSHEVQNPMSAATAASVVRR